jgi:hypothetical protein
LVLAGFDFSTNDPISAVVPEERHDASCHAYEERDEAIDPAAFGEF